MKYQRHNNTSSLFLLELILAVLFFSVASALCIQIFIKAHLMSQNARDLNFAVNEVTSTAEQFSADIQNADITDSSDDAASDLSFQTASAASQENTAYFDADYAACEQENAAYVLTVHCDPEGTLLKAHISMNTVDDNQVIYSLDVTKHRQRRAE